MPFAAVDPATDLIRTKPSVVAFARPECRGDAYDNAFAESYGSKLERELLDDTVFLNRAAERLAVSSSGKCIRHARPGGRDATTTQRQC